MKAIILAAGRGSRLGKYTENQPKGLLQIAGRTILETQVECFRREGIQDISIVVGYNSERINIRGVKYYRNDDYDRTNMVVSLLKAAKEFSDDIIVSYADILFDPAWLHALTKASSDVSVLVDSNWEKYWLMRYGSVDSDIESLVIDDVGFITEIGCSKATKDRMNSRYIGLVKFSRKSLSRILDITTDAEIRYADKPWKLSEKPFGKSYMTDLIQALIDSGIKVNAEKVENGWLEFDTESDYENALSWISSGCINALFRNFNAIIKNNLEEKTMKMVLIRHGESVDDILDCYGGAADYPLSDAGRQTANEVAQSLRDTKIDRIYTSPLKRAIQTADAIEASKQCGISVVAGLRERNSYGVLSGCNKTECKEIFAYLLSELKGKPGDYYSNELVLGAEPKADFDQRVGDALREVAIDAQNKGYDCVAVVTHGNATRSIYQNILHFERKIDLDLLAKTTVSYTEGDFELISKEGVYEK